MAPESCDRDILTDGEGNFKDNASFPIEVGGELEVYYNSNDRKRATTRNKTKNTTTSAGTMIENSYSDPGNVDYMTHFPKKETKRRFT